LFSRLVCLLLHPFCSLFSRTTCVSWYHKGKTSLDLKEARDDGFWDGSGISWTICKQSNKGKTSLDLTEARRDGFWDGSGISWTICKQSNKGKISPDLNEARDGGVLGWQWHQLDHMQTVCTLLQTDNHTSIHHSIFTGQMLF